MSRFERLKNWILSQRQVNGIELPDQGRSSVEGNLAAQIGAALSQYGGLQPEISFQYLEILRQFWIWNPLFNQYADNLKSLANTGHSIVIDAANEARTAAAMQRLNEAAARLWPLGAGVDGLVNRWLTDIAWSGALSTEAVVDFTGRRIAEVVIVPVEQIRFTWDGACYLPHQQPINWIGPRGQVGLIPLNAATYRYFALDTIGNGPYAKPPATSALEDLIGPYADGKTNLKAILKKYGLLGFVSLSVEKLRQKPNETDEELAKRQTGYLRNVIEKIKDSWQNGLLATYNNIKVEHNSVTSNARGVEQIWQIIEGQVFNGFAMQPAFFGRVHSTTETFADVVYSLLSAQVRNVQRLPQKCLQDIYGLDLRLGGVQVNGVYVQFNAVPSRNALADAQAEQARVQTVIEKIKAGLIGADEGAQELGYDSAYDPELLTGQPAVAAALGAQSARAGFVATFRFDRSAQRYRFLPPKAVLAAASAEADNNVLSFAKKKTG